MVQVAPSVIRHVAPVASRLMIYQIVLMLSDVGEWDWRGMWYAPERTACSISVGKTERNKKKTCKNLRVSKGKDKVYPRTGHESPAGGGVQF